MTHYNTALTNTELEQVRRLMPPHAMRLLIQAFLQGEEKYDIPRLGRPIVHPGEAGYNSMDTLMLLAHMAAHVDGLTDMMLQVRDIYMDGGVGDLHTRDDESPMTDPVHAVARTLIFVEQLISAHQQWLTQEEENNG